ISSSPKPYARSQQERDWQAISVLRECSRSNNGTRQDEDLVCDSRLTGIIREDGRRTESNCHKPQCYKDLRYVDSEGQRPIPQPGSATFQAGWTSAGAALQAVESLQEMFVSSLRLHSRYAGLTGPVLSPICPQIGRARSAA